MLKFTLVSASFLLQMVAQPPVIPLWQTEIGVYKVDGLLLVPGRDSPFGVETPFLIEGMIRNTSAEIFLNFQFRNIQCSGNTLIDNVPPTIRVTCTNGFVGYATEKHATCDTLPYYDGGDFSFTDGTTGIFRFNDGGEETCADR